MQNLLLGLALAAVLAWAVWHSVKKAKKGGGCCGEHETVALEPVKDRNPAHYPYLVSLELGGMSCENCARRVANALNALEGVWATVDLNSHRAAVRCKERPDEESLRRAVSLAGYAVMDYRES